jgi:hypothetical protein
MALVLAIPSGESDGLLGQAFRREHLADHAEPVRLVHVEGVAGQQEFLGAARAELPRMSEVLDPAHAQPHSDHVGEAGVVRGHDQVASPHQHQAGREYRALHLGDGNLPQIAPAPRVLEEVMPFLQHPVLGAKPGPAVDLERSVLVRPWLPFLD